MMPDRPIRKFTIIDALALVAATGLGLAAVRAALVGLPSPTGEPPNLLEHHWPLTDRTGIPRYIEYMITVPNAVGLAEPVLLAWSITLILLRLRRPRPPWRRMIVQPGTIVGVVSVLMFLLAVLQASLVTFLGLGDGLDFWEASPWRDNMSYFWVISMEVAWGILSVWLVLALARRWRPEPSWIDRAGRILGIFWILAAFSQVLCNAAQTALEAINMETLFNGAFP